MRKMSKILTTLLPEQNAWFTCELEVESTKKRTRSAARMLHEKFQHAPFERMQRLPEPTYEKQYQTKNQGSLTAEKALAMEPRMAKLAGNTKKMVSGVNPFINLRADDTEHSPSIISSTARIRTL